jgi:hypothetical protein
MSKSLKGIILILFITSLTACEEVDELTEFEVTDTISETQNVDVPIDPGMPVQFSVEESFDLTTVQEIEDNRDLIQSVTINSIEYSFSNFSGNPDAVITEASLSSGGVNILLEDINLKSSADQNVIFDITDQDKLLQLSNQLNSNITEISVTFEGALDGTPVSFDVKFSINLTAVIDVL